MQSCQMRKRPALPARRKKISHEISHKKISPVNTRLIQWSIRDLNPWPPHCQCGALPTALMPQAMAIIARKYGFVIKNFQIHDKIFKYNFAKSPWNTVITACREIRQAVPLRNKYIIWISEHFTLLSPDTSSVLSTPARRSHCRWLP